MQNFPSNFLWGAATSAYQIEGAHLAGGRGLTIWDDFAHTPGKTRNGEHGDIACDHYHRFKEDVQLLKQLGVKAYRFSLAWSRILPSGRGAVNPEGLKFYHELLDELISNDIEPWVTLYHWDLPLALHREMGGWLSPEISDLFGEYARVCFREFGGKVKRWITLNEPWVIALLGYGTGVLAPGRSSLSEPYVVAHNLLRSHGQSVRVYREEFQARQGGIIGITNNCDWREPKSQDPGDIAAAQRAVEFFLGWFADPIYFGNYPEVMSARLGSRLPAFTPEDRALIYQSSDFFGLNHYSTQYASEPSAPKASVTCFDDPGVELSDDPAWSKTDMSWNVVPAGLGKLLRWIDARYQSPDIYITENGCAAPEPSLAASLNDEFRVNFLKSYIQSCLDALSSGVNLRGYFVWSLLDNFEWAEGYGKRFGIHHVDYETQRRTPKRSAIWYRELVLSNALPAPHNE